MKQMAFPFADLRSVRRKPRADFCPYCRKPATTREHVPSKALLEKPYPLNLRTIPSCQVCNARWSLDEEYAMIVLSQISSHPALLAKVEEGGSVDRALMASSGLDTLIINALEPSPDGSVWFKPDLDRLATVSSKLACGLYGLQYGFGSSVEEFSTVRIFGPGHELSTELEAAQWNWPGLRRKRWTVVQPSVFEFLFAKGWMASDPPLYCLINFYKTIFAAVSCPPAIGRKKEKRLRSKPWK